MYPTKHILYGLILSLFFLLVFPSIGLTKISLFFLSSFLVDVDHYFYYVFHKKDLSLRNSYMWFVRRTKELRKVPSSKQKEFKKIILVFHGVESWIVLLLISFYYPIFYYILSGFVFHLFLDWVDIYQKRRGWDSFFGRTSQTYVLLKGKNKKEFKIK